MNSANKLLAAIDAIDTHSISATAPRRVTIDSPLGEWEAVVEQSDPLACSFQLLAVACPILKQRSTDQLKTLSETIAEKMQYLLEPIRLIECEEDAMQIRSDPPSTEADQSRRYYELLVKRRGLSLRRFEAVTGQRRRPVSMAFTREQLRRICNDFEDAIL
jgi:hypothetical protein